MKPETATMRRAITSAMNAGGKLTRYPGGFWCAGEYDSLISFGTSTVEALVKRGRACYTKWQEGRHGRFPIEMTLIS